MKNDEITVRYIVKDVEQSILFYKNYLNFKLDMHPAPGFAALSKDNFKLLINQPGAGGAGQEMSDGKLPEPGGWNRIQLSVDNIESIHQKLKSEGLEFRNKIITGKGGKQVLLKDPSGNLIELFQPNKKKKVKYIPNGYHSITPFIVINDPGAFIDFTQSAFKGKVAYMMKSDDGIIRHSTLKIGDSLIMISNGTEIYKPMPMMLHLFVEDVDVTYERALKYGGKSLEEPHDEFYGDRRSCVEDKWRNKWWIATHIKDWGEEEMKQREKKFREKIKKESKD